MLFRSGRGGRPVERRNLSHAQRGGDLVRRPLQRRLLTSALPEPARLGREVRAPVGFLLVRLGDERQLARHAVGRGHAFVFGVVLVLVMVFRPQGLLPRRMRRERWLEERQAANG